MMQRHQPQAFPRFRRGRRNSPNCLCATPPTLIKERNRHVPAYVQSATLGILPTTQCRFRERYPALYEDYRNSGNRIIDPVHNLVLRGLIPNGNSPYYDRAAELIQSTLYHDACDQCQINGVLEQELENLGDEVRNGNSLDVQLAIDDLLNLLDTYDGLQNGTGMITSLTSRRCPFHAGPYIGLSPRIYKLIREYALRLLPLLASRGTEDEVFNFMKYLYSMTGQDDGFLRRLCEALRIDEQDVIEHYSTRQFLYGGDPFSGVLMEVLRTI